MVLDILFHSGEINNEIRDFLQVLEMAVRFLLFCKHYLRARGFRWYLAGAPEPSGFVLGCMASCIAL